MLTSFDDYPIHQTTEPVAVPMSSERNFYDRYWFNGFDRDGAFIFEAGFGVYPNRHVMDGHFSVVINGVQHAFHTSRRAPLDRTHTVAGPMRLEIVEPMRSIRIRIEANDTGIECDLVFHARTAPVLEPKNIMSEGVRTFMHTSRFTQYGFWEGYFSVGGKRTEVKRITTYGTRDKSWGWRPVGEPEAGAPGLLNGEPGVYWVWAPIHFDDHCTHFNTFEDRDGKTTQLGASIVPVYTDTAQIPQGDDSGIRHLHEASHRIQWISGTRRSRGAEIVLHDAAQKLEITLEPILDFQMLAIGYQHPQWAHGCWKGEQIHAAESWEMATLDPLDYKHVHIHQVVKARMGNKHGIGTLETVCFGRHTPSGFKDLLDGAP